MKNTVPEENKVENKSYSLTLNILNTIRAKNSIKHITCTIGAIKFMNISNDGWLPVVMKCLSKSFQ